MKNKVPPNVEPPVRNHEDIGKFRPPFKYNCFTCAFSNPNTLGCQVIPWGGGSVAGNFQGGSYFWVSCFGFFIGRPGPGKNHGSQKALKFSFGASCHVLIDINGNLPRFLAFENPSYLNFHQFCA